MKKLFGLLTILMFVGLFTHQSQAQGIYGHGGYSWTKGAYGAEFRSGYLGLGLGAMPTKMPMSGDKLTSISAFLSFYTVEEDETGTGLYLTLATTSAGYRMESSYGDSEVSPMTAVTGGLIWNIDAAYLSFGGGWGFYDGGNTPTVEVTLGIRLLGF